MDFLITIKDHFVDTFTNFNIIDYIAIGSFIFLYVLYILYYKNSSKNKDVVGYVKVSSIMIIFIMGYLLVLRLLNFDPILYSLIMKLFFVIPLSLPISFFTTAKVTLKSQKAYFRRIAFMYIFIVPAFYIYIVTEDLISIFTLRDYAISVLSLFVFSIPLRTLIRLFNGTIKYEREHAHEITMREKFQRTKMTIPANLLQFKQREDKLYTYKIPYESITSNVFNSEIFFFELNQKACVTCINYHAPDYRVIYDSKRSKFIKIVSIIRESTCTSLNMTRYCYNFCKLYKKADKEDFIVMKDHEFDSYKKHN